MKKHIIALLQLFPGLLPACNQIDEQANLLFIMTDQQRFDALEMVGKGKIFLDG